MYENLQILEKMNDWKGWKVAQVLCLAKSQTGGWRERLMVLSKNNKNSSLVGTLKAKQSYFRLEQMVMMMTIQEYSSQCAALERQGRNKEFVKRKLILLKWFMHN